MTSRAVFVGAFLVTLLAGCGGTDSTASPAGGTPAAPAASYSPAAAATSDCDVDKTVQAHVTDSHITKIQVIGGCSQVSIETTYTRADFAKAQSLCQSAADVAYVGDVSSVTIVGPDGHELATGEKGNPCIGEP